MSNQSPATPRGPGSFCIPRAAVKALLDAQANAYEICVYLVLACFTDASGCHSSASLSAVYRYTGANKNRKGPVARAFSRLMTINAEKEEYGLHDDDPFTPVRVSVPILYSRNVWLCMNDGELPDGPFEKAKILHVLPDFDEPFEDRVWFSKTLVMGIGDMDRPLKVLKDAGDVAARLLLSLYAANDMETWGGVCPVGLGHGPRVRYEAVVPDVALKESWHLMRVKSPGGVVVIDPRIIHGYDQSAYWNALKALQSAGLIYEVVVVLNRNAASEKLANGSVTSAIPEGAEPLYELDCRSLHGYKPSGEGGIGWATAKTAGDLGHSVADKQGRFDGTYAAIVPAGFGAMVVGIYRLRFRVSNPKNAGVKGAWAGIHQRNRDALKMLNRLRLSAGLAELEANDTSA